MTDLNQDLLNYDLKYYLNYSTTLSNILKQFDLVQNSEDVLANNAFLQEFSINSQYQREVIIKKRIDHLLRTVHKLKAKFVRA
jgi:hypothetical protein